MTFQLRPIRNDLAECELCARIHLDAPRAWKPEHRFSGEELKKHTKLLQDKLSNPDYFFWLAESQGRVVGFHWMEIKDLKSEERKRKASIISLWVDENFRKQGIARALKARGEEWARENRAAFIETGVHHTNERMIRFNKNSGYVPTKIIMIKELDSSRART